MNREQKREFNRIKRMEAKALNRRLTRQLKYAVEQKYIRPEERTQAKIETIRELVSVGETRPEVGEYLIKNIQRGNKNFDKGCVTRFSLPPNRIPRDIPPLRGSYYYPGFGRLNPLPGTRLRPITYRPIVPGVPLASPRTGPLIPPPLPSRNNRPFIANVRIPPPRINVPPITLNEFQLFERR